MEETLDSIGEDDELEEEADAEVDKVLFELTDGKLGQAGRVGAELPVSHFISLYRSLPYGEQRADWKAQKEDEDENEEEVAKMRKEMQELLSG